MKKIFILIIVVCLTGIYFIRNYKMLDPNINSVESMTVMKAKEKQMYSIDRVHEENNKEIIGKILNALKERNKENNTLRAGSYNYAIDMNYRDKKNSYLIAHRYAIWIDDDFVYITIPGISDRSYKLLKDSAKVIIDYLQTVNYEKY